METLQLAPKLFHRLHEADWRKTSPNVQSFREALAISPTCSCHHFADSTRPLKRRCPKPGGLVDRQENHIWTQVFRAKRSFSLLP